MTPGRLFCNNKGTKTLLYLNKQSCFVLSIGFIDQFEINLFAIVSDKRSGKQEKLAKILISLSSPKLRFYFKHIIDFVISQSWLIINGQV